MQHGCEVSLNELDCQVCHVELKLIVILKITNYDTFNLVLEIFKYCMVLTFPHHITHIYIYL